MRRAQIAGVPLPMGRAGEPGLRVSTVPGITGGEKWQELAKTVGKSTLLLGLSHRIFYEVYNYKVQTAIINV